MSRFDDLLARVETYQELAAENYNRIRKLAEDLSTGLCDFLESTSGACVFLVPPQGPFTPKDHGDAAFSMPPRGFRQLGPIAFGLAVRVSKGTDWLRVTLQCQKVGDKFTVHIIEGEGYTFELPLAEADAEPFYQHIYDHVYDWFDNLIERYKEGEDYSTLEIGFDFSDDDDEDDSNQNVMV